MAMARNGFTQLHVLSFFLSSTFGTNFGLSLANKTRLFCGYGTAIDESLYAVVSPPRLVGRARISGDLLSRNWRDTLVQSNLNSS